MKIIVSDALRRESMKKFDIRKHSIVETVNSPNNPPEIVTFHNDFEMAYYVKTFSGAKNQLSILTYGRKDANGNIEMLRAFKIYPDLCPDVLHKRPTQLLYEIAERFGLQVKIGTLTAKFFFSQTVEVQLLQPLTRKMTVQDIMQFIHFDLSQKPDTMLEVIVRHNIDGLKLKIECAMVFGIKNTPYKNWINQH